MNGIIVENRGLARRRRCRCASMHRRCWTRSDIVPPGRWSVRTGRGDACVALSHPGTNHGMRDECGTDHPPPAPHGHSDAMGSPHQSGIGPPFRDRRATHASPLPVRTDHRPGGTMSGGVQHRRWITAHGHRRRHAHVPVFHPPFMPPAVPYGPPRPASRVRRFVRRAAAPDCRQHCRYRIRVCAARAA
jgi:hypothetical protein